MQPERRRPYLRRVHRRLGRAGTRVHEERQRVSITLHLHGSGKYEISIRLEDDSMAGQIDGLKAMLTIGFQTMAATAQDILNKVAEVKDRTDAENVLLDEVHQMLVDAKAAGDPVLMQQAIDQLDAIRQGAVDAITRNTPDAPAATA